METGLFLIWGAICFGILFLSFSISMTSDEIVAAIREAADEEPCCDKDEMLWEARSLLSDVAAQQSDEWLDKAAAWEVKYFGADEDAK